MLAFLSCLHLMQPVTINHDTDITTEDELKQRGIGAESDIAKIKTEIEKLVLSFLKWIKFFK